MLLPPCVVGIKLGDNGTYRCDLMGRHGTIDSVTHTLLVTGESGGALPPALEYFISFPFAALH